MHLGICVCLPVSVDVLTTNAIRAQHASVHGGLSAIVYSPAYSPVYSPAPAGITIILGRSGGSVRREQEACAGL